MVIWQRFVQSDFQFGGHGDVPILDRMGVDEVVHDYEDNHLEWYDPATVSYRSILFFTIFS